ncbi:MAG: Lrp/AsnC ligand binding domain-containing protein [Nanoarchaeota archaeon]
MIQKNDLTIVAHLRENARKSLTQISRATGIPVSTIFEKLKKQTPRIMKKHTCLLDFSKVGMNTRAQIAIRTVPDHRKSLRDYLENNMHVNSLYKINNGYDYLIDVIFANMKDLEEFLEKLEESFKIRTKHVFYVIEEIAREEFLSNPKIIDLLDLEY